MRLLFHEGNWILFASRGNWLSHNCLRRACRMAASSVCLRREVGCSDPGGHASDCRAFRALVLKIREDALVVAGSEDSPAFGRRLSGEGPKVSCKRGHRPRLQIALQKLLTRRSISPRRPKGTMPW